MIDQDALTREWISEVSAKNRKADKVLIEKTVRALLLLEGLLKQRLEFVFKGGTALMLLMNSSKRFSIDIDIIMPDVPEHLHQQLFAAAKAQGFIRFEQQERKQQSTIRKAHFKFFYVPVIPGPAREDYVLLDILFEENPYQKLVRIPVSSAFAKQVDAPLHVSVPSVEDLLGDKLTAFAPNTTGIPYFRRTKSMSMEIIKQLYDIGYLVDHASDAEIVRKTFNTLAAIEAGYRDLEGVSGMEVIRDVIQTALCIISRGKSGNGEFEELQKGIRRVSQFIFSENFHVERAIVFASKAAYAAAIAGSAARSLEKYSNAMEIRNWTIPDPVWPRLNRLRKTNPEAFYYWYRIAELNGR